MQEIQNAREPSNGHPGTIPPAQEKEGYVADLDEWVTKNSLLHWSTFIHIICVYAERASFPDGMPLYERIKGFKIVQGSDLPPEMAEVFGRCSMKKAERKTACNDATP